MSIEKELCKTLALVLLEDRTDQWGNKIESPLKTTINKWANENREDIAKEIIKKLNAEDLAEKVANNVVDKLSEKASCWSPDTNSDILSKLVMEKIADSLAKQQLEKLKTNMD